MNFERRPFKDRLVRNADAIDKHIVYVFCARHGISPERVSDKAILNWIGLKATPTAIKRVGIAINKVRKETA